MLRTKITLTCALLLTTAVASQISIATEIEKEDKNGCFQMPTERSENPIVKKAFSQLTTSDQHRFACILKRAYERDQVDPRMVLFRFLGESGGNAKAVNPSSKAYGAFQFLGGFQHRKIHRSRVQTCEALHPTVNPALIQTAFYVDEYLREFREKAKYGCKKGQPWTSYSNLEKLSYLGLGTCGESALEHTKRHCKDSALYRNASCEILGTMNDLNFTSNRIEPQNLCDDFTKLDCPGVASDQDLSQDPNLWCEQVER